MKSPELQQAYADLEAAITTIARLEEYMKPDEILGDFAISCSFLSMTDMEPESYSYCTISTNGNRPPHITKGLFWNALSPDEEE